MDKEIILLDNFAAKAMQGLLAMGPETTDGKKVSFPGGANSVAKISYDIAEAMVAEREKRILALAIVEANYGK